MCGSRKQMYGNSLGQKFDQQPPELMVVKTPQVVPAIAKPIANGVGYKIVDCFSGMGPVVAEPNQLWPNLECVTKLNPFWPS